MANPSVSSVQQPAFAEGQAAADILLDLIAEKGEVDPHQVLDCRIQWGETTL